MNARAATAQENAAAPSNASSGAATGGGSCARANPPVKQERRAAGLFEGMAVEKWPTAQKKHLRTTTARNDLRRCMRQLPAPSPTTQVAERWPSAQSMALGPTRGPRPVRYATTRTLCGKMQLATRPTVAAPRVRRKAPRSAIGKRYAGKCSSGNVDKYRQALTTI